MIRIIICIVAGFIKNDKKYNTILNFLDNYKYRFSIFGDGKEFSIVGNFGEGTNFFNCSYNNSLNCYTISSSTGAVYTKIFFEEKNFKDLSENFHGRIVGDTVIVIDDLINREFIFELSLK